MGQQKKTPGAAGATGGQSKKSHLTLYTNPAALPTALEHAARGWHVFPAPASGEKKSLKSAKYSDGRRWGATTDPDEIKRDWQQWPSANVGIVTGPESGIFVLDLDCKDGVDGVQWMADRIEEHGLLPDTVEAMSPSGGWHVYFRYPNFEVKTCAGEIAPGVDVRGAGGMVLGVPSVKPGVGAYHWKNPPPMFEVADAPQWVLDLLPRKDAPKPAPEPATGDVWDGVAFTDEGEVHEALSYIDPDAGGYDAWCEILMALHDEYGEAGLGIAEEWSARGEKYKPGEVREKWQSFQPGGGVTIKTVFARAEKGGCDLSELAKKHNPKGSPRKDGLHLKDDAIDLSQDALAVDMGAKDWDRNARFVSDGLGKWLFWGRTHWVTDDRRRAFTKTRAYLRKRASDYIEWAKRQVEEGKISGDPINFLAKAEGEARALRSKSSVAAIEELARSNPASAASVDDFDSDPMLLGTPGGTVDLRTGKVRQPSRDDMITKLTSVAPAPEGARPERWLTFLDEIFAGDEEIIGFMQRAAGYALTGLTTEHKLLFLYGTGRNGKSVFLNVLSRIWADYARKAAAETFLNSQMERHPTDIAGLRGARLVIGSELPRGRTWNESVIKDLTGGDRMTARLMRQDFFDFDPQLTLMIAGNTQPSFRGIDEAIRARVVLVPFTVTIPPERRDTGLTDKLMEEAPAILRWAIDGAIDWGLVGLSVPASVAAASQEYFDGEDIVGQFLREKVDEVAGAFIPSSALHSAFDQWRQDQGLGEWAQNTLIKEIRSRGFEDAKSNGQRGLRGLRLKSL